MPQYDPYSSEQMAPSATLTDYLTSPLRPSTYMAMYSSWPGAWSTSKGLWVPGVGKSLETRGITGTISRAGRMARATIKRKGAIGGSFAIGRETAGRVFSFGMKGGGHVGESFLSQPNNVSKIQHRIAAQSVRNEMYKANISKIDDYISSAKNYTGKNAAALRGLATGQANIKAETQIWKSMLKQGTRNVERYHGLLGKATSAATMRTTAKIGLGLGKVVGAVGGAMFAWDMIKMVGEPLGRAAIRTLDNTLTEYNNRFMPETGGQLELGYLSRGAATERQRAIQAISKSHINGRAAIGNEAQYIHS